MLSVYLSPHLDDAALSCGGRIALQSAGKRPQRVITLFAGLPLEGPNGPPDPEDVEFVEQRRLEDRAALALLGVHDIVHLDLPDGIYRYGPGSTPLYPPWKMCGPVHGVDRSATARMARRVRECLPHPSEAELFAPLGVGRHVDHQLTYQVALLLARAGYAMRFYEDLPYALDEARLQAALARKKQWKREECALGRSHFARKLAAIGEYRSQVPSLFGDERRMRSRLRAHARVSTASDRFVERVWSSTHRPEDRCPRR